MLILQYISFFLIISSFSDVALFYLLLLILSLLLVMYIDVICTFVKVGEKERKVLCLGDKGWRHGHGEGRNASFMTVMFIAFT